MQLRDEFFRLAGAFETEYGVFAVWGDQDNTLSKDVSSDMLNSGEAYGIRFLVNESVARPVPGSQRLILSGLDDWHTGSQTIEGLLSGVTDRDCVIAVAHTPDAVPQLLTQPNGEAVDIILSGHTLGGKIRLFGHELFNPLTDVQRYSAGWHREGNAILLVSEGLNTNWPSLRLGTQPQVHVLKLIRSNESQAGN